MGALIENILILSVVIAFGVTFLAIGVVVAHAVMRYVRQRRS